MRSRDDVDEAGSGRAGQDDGRADRFSPREAGKNRLAGYRLCEFQGWAVWKLSRARQALWGAMPQIYCEPPRVTVGPPVNGVSVRDRLRSEASFARLCGAAPIPVSSGRTDRHRLHRGGDRQANSALWRIALVRMGCHQPTKDYVTRRTAEGKTKTETMRGLKRHIAREVFPYLLTAAPSAVSG